MLEYIKGYEGLYMISSLGRVLSCHCRVGSNPRFLKNNRNSRGYLQVSLCKDKRKKTHAIHVLVAEHFLHKYDGSLVVNHIDENKENNHVTNLEWVTQAENINHGTGIERRVKARLDNRRKIWKKLR